MSESFAPDRGCFACGSSDKFPVALKETPDRHAFDFCDRCFPVWGEALVRIECSDTPSSDRSSSTT